MSKQGKKSNQKQKKNQKPKVEDDDEEEPTNKKEKKAGTGTKVKVRHILCEKFGKIEEAKKKLEEGVPFAEVASQYSEDKARYGGDLGWLNRNSINGDFAQKAFSQPFGVYSEPFKTSFGWHIILVEDRE